MKATGIVRRIDDLGRVVIPKEIRRTLRLREGTPLEIFTDREGEIILKKYSPMMELTAFSGQYAEAMAQSSGLMVCITDRDQVVAVAALYHDAPEIITGDMPTPVKYHSPALRDAYKALETESVRSMAALLPAELAAELTPCMDGSALTAEEHRLLKAADRLSALIKCTEEQRSGNHEFDAALTQQRTALQAMHCPEADWFLEHCLPCYTQNLDELTKP